jgi:hypothetical protein
MKVKWAPAILIIVIIICVFTSISYAKEKIIDATLLDYGICNATVKETTNSETTATGQYNIIENTTFTEKTETIPAKLKTSFGIKYIVNGEPQNQEVKLLVRLIHPPIKGKTKSEAEVKAKIGVERFDVYSFDEEYELVPGEWIFQIFYKKQLLVEKSFKIIKD